MLRSVVNTGPDTAWTRNRKLIARGTFALILGSLVALAIIARMEPRRRAVGRLLASGCGVSCEFDNSQGSSIGARLRRILGKQRFERYIMHFFTIHWISISQDNGRQELSSLTAFPELQILGLGFVDISDRDMAVIGKLKNLYGLSLNETHITDVGLAQLAELPNLRWLDLRQVPIHGSGFAGWKSASTLEHLDCWGSDLDNSGLLLLGQFKNLRMLNLDECLNLRTSTFEVLTSLPKLEEVGLPLVDDEDAAIEILKRLPRLKTLNEHPVAFGK